MMPNSDPWDRFFYLMLTFFIIYVIFCPPKVLQGKLTELENIVEYYQNKLRQEDNAEYIVQGKLKRIDCFSSPEP